MDKMFVITKESNVLLEELDYMSSSVYIRLTKT